MNKNILSQLSTLSDRTRVRLIRILLEEECSVTELVSILEIPQSTISRHIKILLEQHWIVKREDGNSNCYCCKKELLSDSYQALWSVLAADQHELYQQDYRRLQTVLSLRMLNPNNFFKQHATKWTDLRKELFGDQFLLPTLLSMIPSTMCIADIGCGTGEALLALAPSQSQLIGVDLSNEMLQIARERTQQYSNISLRQGSLSDLPLEDDEADCLLCMLVLHHIVDIKQALKEMHRCIKKGGRLIILDMISHHHHEFKQMGHKHFGFSKDMFVSNSLFTLQNFQRLPKAPRALGPELFIATLLSNR